MSFWQQFGWMVFGAIFSLVLSYGVQQFLLWLKNRKRPELFKEWKSQYQGIDEKPGTWVSENLTIDTRFGKIRISNKDSSEGYVYTAIGRLVQNNYIVGDWESIRPGANAYGCFMLTISAQGDSMYGYWVGNDKAGARRYGRWVVAATEPKLDEAKELLELMRKSRLAQ